MLPPLQSLSLLVLSSIYIDPDTLVFKMTAYDLASSFYVAQIKSTHFPPLCLNFASFNKPGSHAIISRYKADELEVVVCRKFLPDHPSIFSYKVVITVLVNHPMDAIQVRYHDGRMKVRGNPNVCRRILEDGNDEEQVFTTAEEALRDMMNRSRCVR